MTCTISDVEGSKVTFNNFYLSAKSIPSFGDEILKHTGRTPNLIKPNIVCFLLATATYSLLAFSLACGADQIYI